MKTRIIATLTTAVLLNGTVATLDAKRQPKDFRKGEWMTTLKAYGPYDITSDEGLYRMGYETSVHRVPIGSITEMLDCARTAMVRSDAKPLVNITYMVVEGPQTREHMARVMQMTPRGWDAIDMNGCRDQDRVAENSAYTPPSSGQ